MHPPAIGVTLNNYERGQSTADRLHMAAAGSSLQSQAPVCPGQICLGSVMAIPGRGTIEPRPLEQVLSQARKLLEQYYATLKQGSDSFNDRFKQVELELSTTGTYILTKSELLFGAKLAWRNSARCIGRIQWNKLHLFDCRHVTTCQEMFDALCTHIQFSTNNGNIRSAITVFPPRSSSRSDFRVWNPQLLSYAGYKNADGSIIGDPINVEFTEVCTKLGWQGEGTQWDILPLVLSSATEGPKYYDLPTELVLQVHLTHPSRECVDVTRKSYRGLVIFGCGGVDFFLPPSLGFAPDIRHTCFRYDWFEKLGIRWYGLPAVSGMLFDCGGVEFPAAPFNGWYMSTEIGCRDLCDPQRYNMLETVAVGMGMDTSTSVNLWKDKALVEKQGVTVVDHHTASSNFMKHMENEQRLRGGCPADWVWIVPPMSGSITPVFHQEMAMYHLKPSFDYQESAWKSHPWKEHAQSGKISVKCKKFHFKQIARAVCLTIRFYRAALLRRIKATVLYATETGKSETYAKRLTEIFNHSFNATLANAPVVLSQTAEDGEIEVRISVYCMDEFDIEQLPHESLLLIVASTFGNGDAPENGEILNCKFLKSQQRLPLQWSGETDACHIVVTSRFLDIVGLRPSSSSIEFIQ
uniref:nitric-oxide synthase (NADPH) n=1 Tax=Timema genevievae TaxID=629358 RepID=A0A7R9JX06_TIMGE|nr:unnamed protein product [Timema genevievae]